MKTITVQFEWITSANAHVLNTVVDDVFDYLINPEYLNAFLNSPTHHLIVSMNEENVVIGFISFVDIYHPDKATQVFINELSVHENYQRNGIATTLMNKVFEYASDHAYYVWVATEMDNTGADAFYQQLSPNSRQDSYFYDWKIKKDH